MSGHEATTATDFFQVHHGIACNGIDVSHWNGPTPNDIPEFVRFMGIKAADLGSDHCPDGGDPQHERAREIALDNEVPYIAHYVFLRAGIPLKEQVYKLAEVVGELYEGECVEIDWEDQALTELDEEGLFYLDALYPGRSIWYVNDVNPVMKGFLQDNILTDQYVIHHPNWNPETGWIEAQRWNSTLWQTGVGIVKGWEREIDTNLILRHDRLREVCGYV